MHYPYLRGRGFQETPVGVVIYKANIQVPVSDGQRLYQLEEKSTVENHHAIALWLTEPGAKVGENTTQLDAARITSAALVLQVDQTVVLKKIPLSHIKACNDQGHPYRISLSGPVNLSESILELNDNAGIPVNTVVEFQVDYPKLKKKRA